MSSAFSFLRARTSRRMMPRSAGSSYGNSDMSDTESLVGYDDKPSTSPPKASVIAKPLNALDKVETEQQSRLMKLPIDIFKCVTDYLDQEDAWSLKRLCRGMARSEDIDKLLYQYPIQVSDIQEIRKGDWAFKRRGRDRWLRFQQSINDSNRNLVHKLAMSHFCSIADFEWIQDNLPDLTCLDLSEIMDFVFTPEETWTWKQLADACPKLFSRIEELSVANWADFHAHTKIQFHYSYGDYRYAPEFRLSRRRDGSASVAKMIFPLCTKLKTISIRPLDAYYSWTEWEIHQRSCTLVDGIQKNCSSTLKKINVHDLETFQNLFLSGASNWDNLEQVDTELFSWMRDMRREFSPTRRHRMVPGGAPRPDQAAFMDEDNKYEDCTRNHITMGDAMADLGNSDQAPLMNLLHQVRVFTEKYPHVRLNPSTSQYGVKPSVSLHNTRLNALQLIKSDTPINANVRPPFGGALVQLQHQVIQMAQGQGLTFVQPPNTQNAQNAQNAPDADNTPPNPTIPEELHEVIRWLVQKCGWKPMLKWDTIMCDVFPTNMQNPRLLPKAELISRLTSNIEVLRSLNVPIRLILRDCRSENSFDPISFNGQSCFADYKCFVGEGDNRRELIAPSQARFSLASIAHLVDELTITYSCDVAGGGAFRGKERATEAQKALLRTEMRGWRLFWARYALLFMNLRKLTIGVSADLYNDWGKSENMRLLLQDEGWDMLDVDPASTLGQSSAYSLFARFRPLKSERAGKKRSRFISRVFFREGGGELQLNAPDRTVEEIEARDISDEEIATKELAPNRFWPPRAPKVEKRKQAVDEEGVSLSELDRVQEDLDQIRREYKRLRRGD